MAPKTKVNKGDTTGAANPRDTGGDPIPASLGTSDELVTPEMKKYQAMLASNPASRIFATLAELYRKHGMYDEAIGLCLRSLKLHPDYLSGRVVLGLAYFDKGMIREAAEELEQVISAKPNHLMAARALGDVMLAGGDIQQAEYYFNRVLSLAPDDPDVIRKLDTLSSQAEPEPDQAPAAPHGEGETGVPEEILEGDALEIVEDLITTPGTPGADRTPGMRGVDLSVDEMSDILVKTARNQPTPPRLRTRPRVADAAPDHDAVITPVDLLPLYRAMERFQTGIVITDLDGTVHYTNRSAAESHGWAPEDPVGRNIRDFFPPGLFQPMTMHEILDKKSLAKDTVNVRKDGSAFPVRVTYDVVDGESSLPAYIIVGIDDLSRHKDVDEDLWQLSIKDAETGLFNRRHFLTRIAEESKRAERIGYPLSLMIITVDNFKPYLAGADGPKGEQVIAELGKITRQSIRKELDSAYRLTEDEFAVILLTATEQKALIVAKRLRDKIAKRLPGLEIRTGTASRQERQSIEELIDAAEKAIYRGSPFTLDR